ncbi:hypothetical protein CBL_07236 [Carabus blaptoides fortunei]
MNYELDALGIFSSSQWSLKEDKSWGTEWREIYSGRELNSRHYHIIGEPCAAARTMDKDSLHTGAICRICNHGIILMTQISHWTYEKTSVTEEDDDDDRRDMKPERNECGILEPRRSRLEHDRSPRP